MKRGRPDATFDAVRKVSNVNALVSRRKEVNTQKFAAGSRPAGGGQGPALDQK